MTQIPKVSGFDQTVSLLREGYDFLPRRFERMTTDILEARFGLQKAICLRGHDAAELFYDSNRFQRRGAAPRRVKAILFGRGGVQNLDGEIHRQRKAMFMSLMDRASIDRLVERLEQHWRGAVVRWGERSQVKLLIEARKVLTRAVCEWAGVPLDDNDVEQRATQLAKLVDGASGVGPRYWEGRLARIQTEAWALKIVEKIRDRRLEAPTGSAAHVVACHREDGKLLPPRVAAVELLNVLRPVVAIDRYIAFTALALHEHASLLDDTHAFVQEVRRYYPFFPVLAARVRTEFEWRGYRFPKGRRVVLDIYGTNHDRRLWDDPETFRPERFHGRELDAFTLIPQGGGDHYLNHRCAGEWITIAVMTAAVRLLTREMSYQVSAQDLRIDHGRIPARPPSDFLIEAVKPVAPELHEKHEKHEKHEQHEEPFPKAL